MRRPAFLIVFLMAGCAPDAPPPAITWQTASSYTYTLTSSCGEQLLHGQVTITVHNGQITAAEGLDESGKLTVQTAKQTSEGLSRLPTLSELIDEYEQARHGGAAVATASLHPSGHPARIDIDYEKNAIDDELCYVIDAYHPV